MCASTPAQESIWGAQAVNSFMWQPVADRGVLAQRAEILASIRAFFAERDVMEVDVPVLATHSVTDPYIDAITAQNGDSTLFLQTSPEYYMKRLLAAGSGPIYYLGKAFRAEARSPRHSSEFTMLEWYRPGLDEHALIAEVIDLLCSLNPSVGIKRFTYADVFCKYVGVDPHSINAAELATLGRRLLDVSWRDVDTHTWLDLLFNRLVEPQLSAGLSVVSDFPVAQSALAKVGRDSKQREVARRFEFYWNGLELANGYCELVDAAEQVRRFDADNQRRAELGKKEVAPDPNLLAALSAGLPECSGVSIGVDRLVMALLGLDEIDQQLSF